MIVIVTIVIVSVPFVAMIVAVLIVTVAFVIVAVTIVIVSFVTMIVAIVVMSVTFMSVTFMIVAFVIVSGVLDDSHVLCAGDRGVDSSFDVFGMQQDVAQRLINHGEHSVVAGCLQRVVGKIAVLEDLQSDLRRSTRHDLLRRRVKEIDRDCVRGFVVCQLCVILLLPQHDQMATVWAQSSVVVIVGCVGWCVIADGRVGGPGSAAE